MRRLILQSFQSPGDVVILTAVVRDFHAACPGQIQTDVRTSADALWQHNPRITRLEPGQPGVEVLDMHYPLIHDSDRRPVHFLQGYHDFLERQLGTRIPVTQFRGEVYLTPEEKQSPPELGVALPERFWIVMAGGKYDFTAKWWNPASYQAVVDHFQGTIPFVQCGEAGHWHPPLERVTNVVGKTSLRDFVRLMYHADGVLCPVTFAMHLAAAVETKPGRPPLRPCVVIAGGREPPHWEAYPSHQFLHTVGLLPCCATGGCWKSRCQTVGDGDEKDHHNLCERPVPVSADLKIPFCMQAITPEDVIRRIELIHAGGELFRGHGHAVYRSIPNTNGAPPATTRRVLLEFDHGLGDCVQLTVVLRHLARLHPDWAVEVAGRPDKQSCWRGLCRQVHSLPDPRERNDYHDVIRLDWLECRTAETDAPSTKPTRCLREVFGMTPQPEWCRYEILISDEARQRASDYLAAICPAPANPEGRYPAVLIHYEGNTSGDRKNLPHELMHDVCQVILDHGHVPVILDWDRRSPLPDGVRIHCPDAHHPLWQGRGTGDAEILAALIEASTLMIGVDSGPLHVAGATSTPTLGVWTHHHPVHFFDLADNVLHLVPGDHENAAAGPAVVRYFQENYRHRTYKQLLIDLPAQVESLLTGADFEDLANKRYLRQLTSTAYDARYYVEHKLAGLDYLGFGDWQQQYGRWLAESLDWESRKVLDVGCACGSILRGLGQAGVVVQGVDVNEHMIQLGREKWPDMQPLLHTCDAVNLHLYADESWDGLHSAQVAEHWKPKLVPLILKELHRVTKPGGLFFCALDTEELFARQGRTLENEDPTHICIKPLSWWHEQLAAAGWDVCSEPATRPLLDHAGSFLQRYDWDWFLARRRP